MFACSAMSGSLKPSRYGPAALARASSAAVTFFDPQIIGTKLTPLGVVMPGCWVFQV